MHSGTPLTKRFSDLSSDSACDEGGFKFEVQHVEIGI